MNMRLDLPHTVYILTKRSIERSEIVISSLGPTPDNTHIGFLVTNKGAWFGRVLSSELIGKGRPAQGSGFPLFPQGSRIVEVPCKGDQASATFRIRLRNFKMEEPLSEMKGSLACDP